MSSHRLRRVVGVLSSSMLAFLLLGPAAATAADNRLILVGSPGAADGSLIFTDTVPGGLTAVDVTITNDGGQTINSVRLLGGTAADDAPVNPLFPAPPPPSLPNGAAYVAAFALEPSAAGPDDCDLPDGGSAITLTCDIGQLRAHESASYRIVIDTPSTAGTYGAWFGAYVAEGNATGTNQDNFYASGTFTSAAATCEASKNKTADYFLPGSALALSSATCTGSTGQKQNASIASGATLGGNGGFAFLEVEDAAATCPTAPGVSSCYGTAVEVIALSGGDVPGGLQWTIKWFGTRSLAGVIHAQSATDYDVIFFTKKYQCSAKLLVDCWVSTSSSKGNVTPSWFEATFITAGNGKGFGFN